MGPLERWKSLDPESRWKVKFSALTFLFLSPVFVFFGVRIVGPDWLGVHFSRTHWRMGADVLVEAEAGPFLFFKLSSEPPGWEAPWNRVIVLDAKDGSTLGTLTDHRRFTVLGVTPREVWVQHTPGEADVRGYALPGMDHLHDLDDLTAGHRAVRGIVRGVEVEGLDGKLHLDCRDGYHYLLDTRRGGLERLPLEHPAPEPSLLYPRCHWEAPGRIYDKRDCTPMRAGSDTIWLDRVPAGDTREWAIIRRSPDGRVRWRTPERKLWDQRSSDDPGLSYDLSVIHLNRIYLSAGDGLDFYAAALDADTGAVAWSRTFW